MKRRRHRHPSVFSLLLVLLLSLSLTRRLESALEFARGESSGDEEKKTLESERRRKVLDDAREMMKFNEIEGMPPGDEKPAVASSWNNEHFVLPEGAKTTQDVSRPRNFKAITRTKFDTLKLNVQPSVIRFEKAQVGWPTTENLTISNLDEEESLKVYLITSDNVHVYTEGISYGLTKHEERVKQRNLLVAKEMFENRRGDVEKHEEKLKFISQRIEELNAKLINAQDRLESKTNDKDLRTEDHEEHELL